MTPSEVIRYGNLKLDFSPCTFRELYSIEYGEATACIGFDFWSAMVAAKADYSSAVSYESGTTYPADSIVEFRGEYKRAKVETTQVPSLASDWETAPKFAGDCAVSYDDFFCTFYAPYVAAVVVLKKLPYIITQIADTGIVYGGKSYNTTDGELINSLYRAVGRDKSEAWANLLHNMSLAIVQENPCFSLWPGYQETTTCGCGCGSVAGECRNKYFQIGGYEFG